MNYGDVPIFYSANIALIMNNIYFLKDQHNMCLILPYYHLYWTIIKYNIGTMSIFDISPIFHNLFVALILLNDITPIKMLI